MTYKEAIFVNAELKKKLGHLKINRGFKSIDETLVFLLSDKVKLKNNPYNKSTEDLKKTDNLNKEKAENEQDR